MSSSILIEYLKIMNNLLPCQNALVVGSGKGSYIEVLKALDINRVTLVEADSRQIEKMHKIYDVPDAYVVENILLYKDVSSMEFYIANNLELSCFNQIDTYKYLMPNTTHVETQHMVSYSLDTFVKKSNIEDVNWLIIDTYTATEILEYTEKTYQNLDVIVCRVLKKSSNSLLKLLNNNNFILVQSFEENNPEISTNIYIRDLKKEKNEILEKNIDLEKKNKDSENRLKTFKEKESELKKKLEFEKKEFEKSILFKIEEIEGLSKEKVDTLEKNIELEKIILDIENQLKSFKEKESELKKKLELENKEFEKSSLLKTQKINQQKKNITQLNIELKKIKVLYESSIIISEQEFVESEYLLKQSPSYLTNKNMILIALGENALKHQKYQKAIYYWQQLAGKLGTKMSQLYYKRLAYAYSHIKAYPLASEEEEVLYGSYDKHKILEDLHEIVQPKFYFEIGVQSGKSLQLAECRALGIDPMPMLKEKLKLNMEVIEHTSDKFFEIYAKEMLTEPLDFVFIDGMHLFEYALRDFINVELYALKNTIVVVDDIYPGHKSQAHRDRKTRAWTGDVWKLLAILNEYRKDLKIVTLDIFPTGLMVIQNLDNKSSILKDNYDDIVQKYMKYAIDQKLYIDRNGSMDPKYYLDELRVKK